MKQARSLLNATRVNRPEAYKLLTAVATLGHKEARSMLACTQLLGPHITSSKMRSSSQDIVLAVQTVTELVKTGLPPGHMVS